ncbi:MAG TPA: hypothetical protein VIN07_14770 [Flavipsychrobacter sp.]
MLYIIEEEKAIKKEVVMNAETNNVFSVLRGKALADDRRFVLPYLATGRVDKEQLADWLIAFNRWLQYREMAITHERDYRRRFAAWFRLRNPFAEQPTDYDPAKEDASVATPAKLVPLPVYQPELPGMGQPATDTDGYKKVLEINTRGKYSPRDNKYDMHWLKSLRDEVRSMGG